MRVFLRLPVSGAAQQGPVEWDIVLKAPLWLGYNTTPRRHRDDGEVSAVVLPHCVQQQWTPWPKIFQFVLVLSLFCFRAMICTYLNPKSKDRVRDLHFKDVLSCGCSYTFCAATTVWSLTEKCSNFSTPKQRGRVILNIGQHLFCQIFGQIRQSLSPAIQWWSKRGCPATLRADPKVLKFSNYWVKSLIRLYWVLFCSLCDSGSFYRDQNENDVQWLKLFSRLLFFGRGGSVETRDMADKLDYIIVECDIKLVK